MAKTHVRVPGGGNTYVQIGLDGSNKVEFMSRFRDQPGRPVSNPVEIHPIDSPYPIEIATAYGQKAGTLTLTVWQTWGYDGWVSAFMHTDPSGNMRDESGIWDKFKAAGNSGNQLNGYPVDLKEVLEAQRMNDGYLVVRKIEKGANGEDKRIKTYHGAVITDITEDDDAAVDTMEHTVDITIMYTHVTVTDA